jgi:hypothetical protein
VLKLKAIINPDQFPFIEKQITVVNRKVVPIRGGNIIFSVTPLYVVAVTKVINMKSWTNHNRNYELTVHEIKVPIEILEV